MHKTISVFFSGTGFSIHNPSFLAASLYKNTVENEQQIKMGFDGCGVLYPFSGTIFGSGLDEQATQVIERITEEIADGHEIRLNVYGHSRGAIAALMLAQQLSLVDPAKLSINMALLDPVPGNLISTSSLDSLNLTLANKVIDLTDCKPLKKVLALYPHKPLADLAFHAPLFASYPKRIELEEDIIAGCHAEAEIKPGTPSKIAKHRVYEFFVENGTQFNNKSDCYTDTERLKAIYLTQYKSALAKLNSSGQPMTKDAHSANGVFINTKIGAQYYNEHHKRLANGNEEASVALTIEQGHGPILFLKHSIAKYPLAWQLLKWSALSLLLGSLLFLTGGLGAIPVVGAAIVAQLGAFSIVVVAPITGTALAALWYGAIKPALSWTLNRIFYPMYSLREIKAAEPEFRDGSLNLLVDRLNKSKLPRNLTQLEAGNAPYHGNGLFKSPIDTPSIQDPQENNTLFI